MLLYHSLYLDRLACILSLPWVWLPLILLFLYMLIRNNNPQELVLILVSLLFTIVFTNQTIYLLQTFLSSPTISKTAVVLALNYHKEGAGLPATLIPAAPAVFMFLALLVRHRNLNFCLAAWAVLCSWTRQYLSIVSTTEWLSEFLVGVVIGVVFYKVYALLHQHIGIKRLHRVHALRTITGYDEADLRLLVLAHAFTFLVIGFFAFLP